MRSSLIRPLALSSSYLTLDPNGISMTQSNSCGSLSPGVTSCQGWIIGVGNHFYFSGGFQLSAVSSQLSVRSVRKGCGFLGAFLVGCHCRIFCRVVELRQKRVGWRIFFFPAYGPADRLLNRYWFLIAEFMADTSCTGCPVLSGVAGLL